MDKSEAFDWLQQNAHVVTVVRAPVAPEGTDPVPDVWTVRTINPNGSVSEHVGRTLLEAVEKAAGASAETPAAAE